MWWLALSVLCNHGLHCFGFYNIAFSTGQLKAWLLSAHNPEGTEPRMEATSALQLNLGSGKPSILLYAIGPRDQSNVTDKGVNTRRLRLVRSFFEAEYKNIFFQCPSQMEQICHSNLPKMASTIRPQASGEQGLYQWLNFHHVAEW